MRRELLNLRAIVTGASSGIGRALALELARAGGDVVLVARSEDKLTAVAGEISKLGRRAEVVVGDVTQSETRAAAVAAAIDRLGGLDLLINNAGIGAMGPFHEADPQRLRQLMEVNFFALVEMTRAALPELRNGRRPMIVNIGSVLGHVPLPTMSEYTASKFAVCGFSDALRAELFQQGIDVLLVSPGTTETEFFNNLVEDRGGTSWRADRGATPESLARQTVKAIRRGKREIIPGGKAKLIYWFQRCCPRLLHWVLARKN